MSPFFEITYCCLYFLFINITPKFFLQDEKLFLKFEEKNFKLELFEFKYQICGFLLGLTRDGILLKNCLLLKS